MEARRISRAELAGLVGFFLAASGGSGRAQEIVRVSLDSNGVEGNDHSEPAALSADGRYVVFASLATNLVTGDTNAWNDVFVRDRVAGTTERVSVDSSGAEGVLGDWAYYWNWVAISSDGQIVAFDSDFVNLVTNDTNDHRDVFIHDRATGVTERVSVDSQGAEGDDDSGFWHPPAISADGQVVAFESFASNLVPGDTNADRDVFVRDRSTGITERVSVDASGIEGNAGSGGVAISPDGRFVAFASAASNLVPGDTNGWEDVFVRDRATGAIERVSIDSNGVEGDGRSWAPSISADGSVVAFISSADNFAAGHLGAYTNVYLRDRIAGTTELVSVDPTGQSGDRDSGEPGLSGDGMLVAFGSSAENLVPGDSNRRADLFIRDRAARTTTLLSRNTVGELGNGHSGGNAFSADGRNIAFMSIATNLISGDTNRSEDVFVCMLDHVKSHSIHYGAGWPGTLGVPSITPSADPTLGTTISIDVANSFGAPTSGLLVLGYQRAQIPSVWGGELLVDPFLVTWIDLDASGFTMTGDVPNDPSLTGLVIDLQAMELDGGASHDVSFTDGLELVLGD
jgi:Tol biopolymer transport system component